MKYLVMLLAITLMGTAAQAADSDFQKVVSCMRASVPPVLQAEHFMIEATDKTGKTRVLEGKFFAKRENDRMRVMLNISSPATVAGASYLVIENKDAIEDNMYVFLPTVNRVRHITGAFANGSLLGTDFSYAEIKQITNAFSGSTGKLIGTDKIDGREVSVITLQPPAAVKSPYSSVQAWVDQQSCYLLKAEFNVGKTVRKRLTVPAESIRQSGKFWYLSQLEMQDLKLGTRTVTRLDGVDSSRDIPSSLFDPATFHIGHK